MCAKKRKSAAKGKKGDKEKTETPFEDQAARKKSKAAQLRKLATKVISRATWPS